MKKVITTITLLIIIGGMISLSMRNGHRLKRSVLNNILNGMVLYADDWPADSDTLHQPSLPPNPPIK